MFLVLTKELEITYCLSIKKKQGWKKFSVRNICYYFSEENSNLFMANAHFLIQNFSKNSEHDSIV